MDWTSYMIGIQSGVAIMTVASMAIDAWFDRD